MPSSPSRRRLASSSAKREPSSFAHWRGPGGRRRVRSFAEARRAASLGGESVGVYPGRRGRSGASGARPRAENRGRRQGRRGGREPAQAAAVTLAGLLRIWSANKRAGFRRRSWRLLGPQINLKSVGEEGRSNPGLYSSRIGPQNQSPNAEWKSEWNRRGRLSHRGTTLGTLFPL